MRLGLLLCFLAFTAPPATLARDFFLTIGGGYSPSGNQASLENNVLLFQRLLREQGLDHFPNDVYFSDGNASGHDLQVLDRDSVPKANRLMAEFFGSRNGLGLSYRNHRVPDVRGGTKPENIRKWFDDVGSTMMDGDRLLLYVTAHGKSSRDRRNPHNTTIATWNNTAIPMTELVRMLDQLSQGVEVVAIMVQCHAGGFARFVFNDGDPDQGLSQQRRIGFFATVHDRAAAGCTPEIDEASYVEYSTYFWAALAGHDRAGNVINLPDYNGDGIVSFDEAHAYTVLTADTIDLPVKTSDEFLRVHSEFGNGESALLTNHESYKLIAKYATRSQRAILDGLSRQLELSGDDRIADARKATTKRRSDSKRRSRHRRSAPKEQLRREIAGDMKRSWPELANVLNPVAIEMITTRSGEFVEAIEEHPDYSQYRDLADNPAPNYKKIKVKYERFLRAADNVVLAENLRRMNDPGKLMHYEAIVEAESSTLHNHGVQR